MGSSSFRLFLFYGFAAWVIITSILQWVSCPALGLEGVLLRLLDSVKLQFGC